MSLIEYLNIDDTTNVYIVGDIHGMYDLLINELNDIGFNYDNDLLISVGDLIDRGPKNEECLLLIGKPWFKCIRGNHEQLCIDGYYSQEVKTYHIEKRNGGKWFYDLPYDIQTYVVNEFQQLPLAIEIRYKNKTYGVVHAEVPYDDWLEFKYHLDVNSIMLDGKDTHNATMRNRYKFRLNDVYINNIDKVYMGHSITKVPKFSGNCVYIDTGAVFRRQLTIMKVE